MLQTFICMFHTISSYQFLCRLFETNVCRSSCYYFATAATTRYQDSVVGTETDYGLDDRVV
jgi:hypothetical protein